MTPRSALAALALFCTFPASVEAQGVAVPGQRIRDVLMQLSPAGRQIFIDNWLNVERGERMAKVAAARAERQRILAAMAAEPFNAQNLRRAYADARAGAFRRRQAREERLANVLARLSPADRRIVVSRMMAMQSD